MTKILHFLYLLEEVAIFFIYTEKLFFKFPFFFLHVSSLEIVGEAMFTNMIQYFCNVTTFLLYEFLKESCEL